MNSAKFHIIVIKLYIPFPLFHMEQGIFLNKFLEKLISLDEIGNVLTSTDYVGNTTSYVKHETHESRGAQTNFTRRFFTNLFSHNPTSSKNLITSRRAGRLRFMIFWERKLSENLILRKAVRATFQTQKEPSTSI